MRVPMPAGSVLVECPDCEATFPARAGAGIWAATEAHNRICGKQRNTTRGNTMSTTLKAVEDGKRPHPKQLLALIEMGETPRRAAERAGISVVAAERWFRRNGPLELARLFGRARKSGAYV